MPHNYGFHKCVEVVRSSDKLFMKAFFAMRPHTETITQVRLLTPKLKIQISPGKYPQVQELVRNT